MNSDQVLGAAAVLEVGGYKVFKIFFLIIIPWPKLTFKTNLPAFYNHRRRSRRKSESVKGRTVLLYKAESFQNFLTVLWPKDPKGHL